MIVEVGISDLVDDSSDLDSVDVEDLKVIIASVFFYEFVGETHIVASLGIGEWKSRLIEDVGVDS